jgi:pimeloyl-ACP methyl ester carboxylesterase
MSGDEQQRGQETRAERWCSESIGGKPADVFEPSSRPQFGVIFLHPLGLETLVDQPIFTRALARPGLACVCPHGDHSWWTDRICREFDPHVSAERYVLDHIVSFFAARWHIVPRAIGLLGISMGGQGALRLAFRHPHVFPVCAGIASAIDYHELYGLGTTLDDMYESKEQCRQDTPLMHLPPYNPPPHIYYCIDPEDVDWYRGNDRLHEKMNALGVEHTADLATSAGGHSWEYFNHMAPTAVQFIHQGLEKESRRLL